MSNIRLFFAGDFCSKPSTSRISVSDELKSLIESCDVKVVNFEVPLTPLVSMPPQKRERFFQHDDASGFLCGLGFNVFSLANNHALGCLNILYSLPSDFRKTWQSCFCLSSGVSKLLWHNVLPPPANQPNPKIFAMPNNNP